MSRTLKGTRARGLPPKLLLSQRQDATGSFPTKWRTASDNRTGKYPVFFNDDKVVPFNQYEAADYDSKIPLGNAVYIEEEVNTGPVLAGVDKIINFTSPFAGVIPVVVISELKSSNNSHGVNVFLKAISSSKFTIQFSSEFNGSIVYRAAYDPNPGTLRVIERKPRYPGVFTRFVAKTATLSDSNTADITFNDFGDDIAENFVTFFDNAGNNQADIWPNITTQTRTLVALTASSIATATVEYERFHGLHNRGIIYPLGMNQSTILAGLSAENQIEMYGSVSFLSGAVVNQPTKWIVASGNMKKNVADTFITFTPGQDIQAFRDSDNPAVDGKRINNAFYATGSAVEIAGQGFQQPLWSKSKIEIPLDISTPVIFGQSTNDNEDKLMAYYDHRQKTFVPIGDFRTNAQMQNGGTLSPSEYIASKSMGFSPSSYGYFHPGVGGLPALYLKNTAKIFATPFNAFGFPFDKSRYSVRKDSNLGTSNTVPSMLFSMEEYISEPFLLEKVVLEFTGSMHANGSDNTGFSAISTFFILNQLNTGYTKTDYGYVSDSPLTNYPITSSTVGMDLVTYMQIAALTSSLLSNGSSASLNSLYSRDLSLYQDSTSPVVDSYGLNVNFGYSGSFVVSASLRKPKSLNYSGRINLWSYDGFSHLKTDFTFDNRSGNRKMISEPCGRNWNGTITNQTPAAYAPIQNLNQVPIALETYDDDCYILLPTDNLIFGWQTAVGNVSGSHSGNSGDMCQLSFPNGPGKIILYGSTLRVNPETNQLEEYHDTLNQLFSSNSIHEGIGD